MDIRLRILEELYDGDAEQSDRMCTEHPELTGELNGMRSMKSALDARPRRRPDRSAIDAVVSAAADASAGRSLEDARPRARQDRKPRARRAVYLRSAGMATAVVTILIAVTTVWQANFLPDVPPLTGGSAVEAETAAGGVSAKAEDSPHETVGGSETVGTPETDGAAETADAARGAATMDGGAGTEDLAASRRIGAMEEFAEAEDLETAQARALSRSDRAAGLSLQDGSAGGDRSPQPGAERRPSASSEYDVIMSYRSAQLIPAGTGSMDEAVVGRPAYQDDLAWDQMADVVEVYRQIEVIEDGVALGWEPPSVPLEMMPTPSRSRETGIQPAGERRRP